MWRDVAITGFTAGTMRLGCEKMVKGKELALITKAVPGSVCKVRSMVPIGKFALGETLTRGPTALKVDF